MRPFRAGPGAQRTDLALTYADRDQMCYQIASASLACQGNKPHDARPRLLLGLRDFLVHRLLPRLAFKYADDRRRWLVPRRNRRPAPRRPTQLLQSLMVAHAFRISSACVPVDLI
jgi:hypothetical protein